MSSELRNDLVVAMDNDKNVLYQDPFIVIIWDKYPKSKFHFLVLPREDIPDVRSIKKHHSPKLVYMELKGLEIASMFSNRNVHEFYAGYHAYPSMNRLHLHILSNDFCSVHLKHVYQWNSFHTEFFLPSHQVIVDVQINGSANIPPNKKCLQQPLNCHKCSFVSNDIHNMKLHQQLFHG